MYYKLMTVNDLKDYLRLDRRTLYRLIKENRIPAIKVSGQWRFRKEQIDDWLENQQNLPKEDLLPKKRILVVDDDEDVRNIIQKAFAKNPEYRVDTVSNGFQALDILRKTMYHLMFVDIKMPGIDGLELIRQAKEVQKEIKAIVITGYPSKETAIEALNSGVTHYLEKPLDDINQIVQITNKVLQASPVTN
jgi:excisionase family DNA binding protein